MSLSNGSVNSYLQRARIAGLRWPLPVDLDDGALERPLFPPAATAEAARARPRPGWADVDKEMRRIVTLALLRGGISRRTSGRVWKVRSGEVSHVLLEI
jgi:transposase